MFRIILYKFGLLLAASFVGLAAGTAAATPLIALLNYLATDGPLFPPLLVAFGLVALPVTVILLPSQAAWVGAQLILLRRGGRWPLLLGPLTGLTAGAIWLGLLRAAGGDSWVALALLAGSAGQGLAVFSCHWLGDCLLHLERSWGWAEAIAASRMSDW